MRGVEHHRSVAWPVGLGLLGCAVLLGPAVARLLSRELPIWISALTGHLALRATDGWAIGGGAALALAGAAMVVTALLPGTRQERTRGPLMPGVRASLDRRGVGSLLRDTALRVPGVAGVRVRVHRRRAVVRAVLAFGDPSEARETLLAALAAHRDRLGLTRPPRLVVRIAPLVCHTP
ncbi:DUF6286 domain-containing protein [Streptomyces sp. NPDC017993]|uniref:DUF6286 domain-containing protein n=1 Tax=Streptomyces sp. NPDC017993 TaxID=3365027 RepID=UPI0037BD6DEF